MKRSRIVVIMLILILFTLPLGTVSALAEDSSTDDFIDVKASDPNSPYIYELYQKKLIEGIGDRRFGPDEPLNREQFAKMIVTAFRIPAGDGTHPFTDLTDDWAKPYVAAAYQAKAIQGLTDTTFGPLDTLTKQAAATIVYRWLDSQGVKPAADTATYDFSDADDWAKTGVAFVLGLGLRAEGTSHAAYDSKKQMTRGEAAALIALAIRKLEGRLMPAPQKPDASGASQEQAISLTSPGSMTDIPLSQEAWLKTRLAAGYTAIVEAQDADAVSSITIRDGDGNYRAQEYGNSIRFEPLSSGDYYIVLSGNGLNSSKKVSLSVTDGSGFTGAYPLEWKDGQARQETRIPAKGQAYYRVDLQAGLPYVAKLKVSGTVGSIELFDPVQQSVGSQTGYTLTFTAKRDGIHTLKVTADTDANVEVTVSPVGGSKTASVPILAGTQETNVLPDGTLWLSFSPLFGRYFHVELEGAEDVKTEATNFSGSFVKNGELWVMESHFPIGREASMANAVVYVQALAAPGAKLRIRYEDGGTVQGAFLLSRANKMQSSFPVYRTYRDESYYYQVDLTGGKTYQLQMTEGNNEYDPKWINLQLDHERSIKENGQTVSALEPKLQILDSNLRELQTVEGRIPVYRPLSSGTYYLRLITGTSAKGYLLKVTEQ